MLILKAIDPITDDVKVGQSYVKKSKFGGGTGIFNYGRLMAALFSNVEVH